MIKEVNDLKNTIKEEDIYKKNDGGSLRIYSKGHQPI